MIVLSMYSLVMSPNVQEHICKVWLRIIGYLYLYPKEHTLLLQFLIIDSLKNDEHGLLASL